MNRRQILMSLGAAAAAQIPAPAFAQSSPGPASGISRVTAYGFSFKGLDGRDIPLSDHQNRPILIVNTASLCGFTPQYAGLEQLWTRFRQRGLLVLGVPSNDFGGQEPGQASDISHTAHQHGVTFPLTEKVAVKGANAHPFYRWAALQRPGETPRWNFHKYLVGADGMIAATFGSPVDPLSAPVVIAIEKALAA